jgi:hypothetical protein
LLAIRFDGMAERACFKTVGWRQTTMRHERATPIAHVPQFAAATRSAGKRYHPFYQESPEPLATCEARPELPRVAMPAQKANELGQ